MSCLAPMTSEEFIKSTTAGETAKINNAFKTVTTRTSKIFNNCFNVVLKYRSSDGTGTNMDFTPKIKNVADAVIYSVQQENSNSAVLGGAPKDGMFIFTAKINKISKNSVLVETYSILGRGNLEASFISWAKGKSKECPSL